MPSSPPALSQALMVGQHRLPFEVAARVGVPAGLRPAANSNSEEGGTGAKSKNGDRTGGTLRCPKARKAEKGGSSIQNREENQMTMAFSRLALARPGWPIQHAAALQLGLEGPDVPALVRPQLHVVRRTVVGEDVRVILSVERIRPAMHQARALVEEHISGGLGGGRGAGA